jgi:hypothetical protein
MVPEPPLERFPKLAGCGANLSLRQWSSATSSLLTCRHHHAVASLEARLRQKQPSENLKVPRAPLGAQDCEHNLHCGGRNAAQAEQTTMYDVLIHQKTSLFPRSYSHNKLGRSCLMVESWSWSFLIGSFASLQGATVECRVWMRNWAQSRSCRRSHELDQCPSRFGDQHAPLGFKLL